MTTCAWHPGTRTSAACGICARSVCNVCDFVFPSGSLCPECVCNPAAGIAPSGVGLAVGSLLFALVGVAGWIFSVLAAADVESGTGPIAFLVGLMVTAAPLTGLAMAIVGRDRERSRGAVLLPTVSLFVNGALYVGTLLATTAALVSGE
jgi:hypothetical protein